MNTNVRTGLMVLTVATVAGLAPAQGTARISVDAAGLEGDYESRWPSISADGRYVAFMSLADNLVPGDTNGYPDIFVRDRMTGTNVRVSVDSTGFQSDGDNEIPHISADGRYVTWMSTSGNLVFPDFSGLNDIFEHDTQTGVTLRVNVDSTGAEANADSYWCAISGDGRYVAFGSGATNLVAGDTNHTTDVFVHDLLTAVTERVSVDSNGVQSNGSSGLPSISADGRFVVFQSLATNLSPGGNNGHIQVHIHDRLTGTTSLVSADSTGVQGNNDSSLLGDSISASGRYVTFWSRATNLVAGDTNGKIDIFVRDMQTGVTTRASVDSAGNQSNGDSLYPALSGDGRYVAFQSRASNLVPGDTNGAPDVFLHDLQTGQTTRVSSDSSGAQGNGESVAPPNLSFDGRYVAYWSAATNLVPSDTNAALDVFMLDRGATPIESYCFGDGSGTACPCGAGTLGNGCPNSLNANGANLVASGTPSVFSDTLALSGSGMPDSSALYFEGTARVNAVFGDGLRCARVAVVRLGTKMNANGASQIGYPTDASISSHRPDLPGDVRNYQISYRNAAGFCTSDTFNLTNGLQVTWGP